MRGALWITVGHWATLLLIIMLSACERGPSRDGAIADFQAERSAGPAIKYYTVRELSFYCIDGVTYARGPAYASALTRVDDVGGRPRQCFVLEEGI